ncbi:phosphate ABC transporter membrane protein 1, PhoT family [Syntrophus gentianae]|uniref:Phosphate transport system permease protein n=1 Tax=Syntrophus gentianae TaxID=43775 RepID=A0A1H7YVL2_9BACT|nr:phosphate ABC transporter permease subunit PstC [Syntrophus gentianae]SEM50246.1 phosphate ABC transporter membrane protein 1, PhoT family [Syntrophus gentianae]
MKSWRECLVEKVFLLSTLISSSLTLLVLGFMAFMALPVLRGGGLFRLLTEPWAPQQGFYGIYPMIVSTAVLSLLSLVFAFPLSLGCSFLISAISPKSLSAVFRRMVQMMTGIPTVIYGFVGIFLLVPVIREVFQSGSGMCLLSASLMLGVLISPTMILFFCDSFDRVPRSFINAAASLGADRAQTLLHVVLPSARKGIVIGILLAFGRAVGDTLISLMIAGNSVMMPGSLLDSVRTLTAQIALVIAADYESPEFRSIFACGLVLYLFISLVILIVRRLAFREMEGQA